MIEFEKGCGGVVKPCWAVEWACHSALLYLGGNFFGHELPMWVNAVLLLL